MRKFKKLTQARLKELLHYDPETGIFTRKITTNYNAKKGDIAGCVNACGYLQIRINGKYYLGHRLAWLCVYGYFPENDIDHKDRIKHHNWIDNLRESSKQCNARNCENHITNTSGVKGVCWDKHANKWHAQIVINKQQKHLGYYKNFDNAVCARLATEQCLGWSRCDSNSSAYQYIQKILKRPKKRKLPRIIV